MKVYGVFLPVAKMYSVIEKVSVSTESREIWVSPWTMLRLGKYRTFLQA